MSRHSFHELFDRDEAPSASNRSFCTAFAVVFTLIGICKFYQGRASAELFLACAGLFIVFIYKTPAFITPVNALWSRIGHTLSRIISPIILGLLYYSTIVPMGLLMRVAGKRPLPLDFDPQVQTYWITRKPAEPETMLNQF